MFEHLVTDVAKRKGPRQCCALIGALLMTTASSRAEPTTTVGYREAVRPILAANCFKCHGPDAQTRAADLRLDEAESATADRGGYHAILPGNAAESEVVKRILSDDPSVQMPPPDSKKKLSAEQKEILQAWIAAGAKYERHWAFVPPQRPTTPNVQRADWVRNDIDAFVLAELERRDLTPSPEADRRTLIRRLSLDLVGLPPTPERVAAFVLDNRPNAYERLVDELLASPHYGERWARRWLDLARYSDTNGYEKDRPRAMWPYRDWVIDALNADLPFDQFTIEQLAGDMLPNATRAQRLATGFHRNTMVNEEGGIDPQEFRFKAVVDRVATTGAVWLGMTLGCAQCHTHKFDPISHQEYYQVFAFLNNEDDVDELINTPEITAKRAELQAQIDALVAKLPERYPFEKRPVGEATAEPTAADRAQPLATDFAQWLEATSVELSRWRRAAPVAMSTNLALLEVLPDQSVLASGDVTKNDKYQLEFELPGATLHALRLEALTHESLPQDGPGRQTVEVPNASGEGDFFLSELYVEVVSDNPAEARVIRTAKIARGAVSYVGPGLSAESAFDGKGDSGWRVLNREGEPHVGVFALAEPVTLGPGERLRIRLEHESFYAAGLGRFRFSFAEAPLPSELSTPPVISDELAAVLAKPAAGRTAAETEELRRKYLLTTPKLVKEREPIDGLQKQLLGPVVALITRERATHPRETHRFHRGEYLQPKEVVTPGVPSVLPPLPSTEKPTRLDFARWLVDPKHPLTARVTVNRQWQAFFGAGIVRTLEDFGLQGESPTHPELLDFLATEFVSQGWSLKKLHRLIVTSATYRQSSTVRPELLAADPENRYLSRGARFRVEAELVRDIVLAASGLLSPQIGGPSVFPDQPPGVTEGAYGPLEWKVSTGPDRYRRGLYSFNKRTAPYAAFGLFDAPSGEACVARRNNSNTPLQSLAVLNDEVTMAAARKLAQQAWKAGETQPERITNTMYEHVLSRPPTTGEFAALARYQHRQLNRLEQGELDATALLQLAPDEAALVDATALAERRSLAAWTLAARAILNLDETITRQ